jgi:hypothetical protein
MINRRFPENQFRRVSTTIVMVLCILVFAILFLSDLHTALTQAQPVTLSRHKIKEFRPLINLISEAGRDAMVLWAVLRDTGLNWLWLAPVVSSLFFQTWVDRLYKLLHYYALHFYKLTRPQTTQTSAPLQTTPVQILVPQHTPLPKTYDNPPPSPLQPVSSSNFVETQPLPSEEEDLATPLPTFYHINLERDLDADLTTRLTRLHEEFQTLVLEHEPTPLPGVRDDRLMTPDIGSARVLFQDTEFYVFAEELPFEEMKFPLDERRLAFGGETKVCLVLSERDHGSTDRYEWAYERAHLFEGHPAHTIYEGTPLTLPTLGRFVNQAYYVRNDVVRVLVAAKVLTEEEAHALPLKRFTAGEKKLSFYKLEGRIWL